MSDIIGFTWRQPEMGTPVKRPSLEFLMKENGFDSPGEGGPPMGQPPRLTPAIYVKDGVLVEQDADKTAICGGDITGEAAKRVKLVSYNGNTGGIYVEGCDYLVEDAVIHLSGDGMGLGGKCAGAGVGDHGTLTLRRVHIDMSGESRCATSAGESSILRVYDSTLASHGAPYGPEAPADKKRITPPAALEIAGNCRTHCTVQNSYSYFYNSTIMTDGWAALSTDMSEGFVYLEANDCRVISTKNGYGAYADTYCHDRFRRCVFDVSAMAAIIAGVSDVTFEDCALSCKTYLALMHCVMGQRSEVGQLTMRGGSAKCGKEAVLIKSQNAIVRFQGSSVSSEAGVLVRSIVNTDPVATRVSGHEVYGIHVLLEHTDLTGDILHEDPERKMTVALTSACLRGKIENAGLRMDMGSKWTATADSHIRLYGGIELEQLDAPAGVTIYADTGTSGEYSLASGGRLICK